MKRILAVIAFTLLSAFNGCTTPGTAPASLSTPEALIAAGANAETAAAVLATTLLKNDRITTTQAKSYSTLLHAASSALDDANKTLVKCRADSGSTPATTPDPCALGVADVIRLATASIASIQQTLAAK